MDSLLDVRNLKVSFVTGKGRTDILHDLNFTIGQNEVLALIGETGCGKTVTANTILGLLPDNAIINGEIRYKEMELTRLKEKDFLSIRGKEIAVIPQNPSSSLNPLMKVGSQVAECIRGSRLSRTDKESMVHKIFSRLQMPRGKRMLKSYPCELSGGMSQRVLIAMGMIASPSFLIVDEPTKAIDWALRKDVVDILKNMREELSCSMLLITHDIAAAKHLADRIAVMYCGFIVEIGSAQDILNAPRHPYTKGLLASMPSNGFHVIPGFMPSFQELPRGCPFMDRCDERDTRCGSSVPDEIEVCGGHFVRCFSSKINAMQTRMAS